MTPHDGPNIIVVVLDTARADVFEPYGAAPGSTPTVSQLARQGSAAPSMYAPSGWTLPSHASMFTGLSPRLAGLARAPQRDRVSCKPVMESHRARLLPEVLRRQGYDTRGVSCNMWVTAESGFATGFDSFVAVDGPRTSSMIKPGLAGAAKWAWHALLCHDDDGANETTEILRSFLADRDERPFFWFVNLVECHSPYLPPRPYADRGPIARVKAARANRRHMTLGAIWRACLGGFDISDEDLALLRHFYEQSIRLLDDWLAQLLESLDAAGVLDDTLLIITSDHGENFGEGRLIGHTLSLDDRLLRVPFIATGPGAPVLRRVASLTELPRLVAEAIGLSDHPWGDSHLIDSIAVAQFDAPADRGPQATETMLEWGLGDGALDLLTSAQTAVTDGRFKLVRRAGTDVLFDLEADPLELHPQAPSSSPEALRKALERAAAEAAAPVSHGVVEPDRADLEERMRMLGYM